MKRILLTLLFIICYNMAFATAQASDKIIYNDSIYSLNSNPLDKYFKEFPDKKPIPNLRSTALWRGYIATFEIKDGELLVKEINVNMGKIKESKWVNVVDQVFPDKTKADWVTGLLVIPLGKVVDYVHMGYASTYAEYILLEIKEGNLMKEKRLSHKEYEALKEKQFEAFKKTTQYADIVKAIKDEDESATSESIDSFLKLYNSEYSSKILDE